MENNQFDLSANEPTKMPKKKKNGGMVGGHMKTWDPTCNHALLDNSQAVRIWHLTFQFRYKTLLETK